MPKYEVSTYNVRRYTAIIEADNQDEAIEISRSFSPADFELADSDWETDETVIELTN
jgi:hypothetical protein